MMPAPQLVNTIVAGNSTNDYRYADLSPDVYGPCTSMGNNLIGMTDGSSGWGYADLTGAAYRPLDPRLGPLQYNGGPTQTMALLLDSPARQDGDTFYSPGPYDQRGAGYSRIVSGRIDIGAYEVQYGGGAAAGQGTNAMHYHEDSAATVLQPQDASDAFFAAHRMKGDSVYLEEMQF